MLGDTGFRDALLDQNGEGGGHRTPVQEIVRRDRRRLRWWLAATIVVWIAVAVHAVMPLLIFLNFIQPILFEVIEVAEPRMQGDPRLRIMVQLQVVMLFWPLLLLIAAVATLAFTHASRRATMRQIQASLAQISAELAQSRRADAEG